MKKGELIHMTVGENIQRLRKKLGLSQEGLAEKLFLTRQTVSQWETDQTMPTLENVKLLKDVSVFLQMRF